MIYIGIILLLAILSAIGFSKHRLWNVGEVTEKRDTIFERMVDTIRMTDVRYVEKKVVDTVYVPQPDGDIALIPMSNYRFRKDGAYDMNIYGYGVVLKNIDIYPETRTYTITNTIEKSIEVKSWDFYLGFGLGGFSNGIIPTIQLNVKTPQRWLLGVNLGYYNKSLYYGASVSYKIGKI